MQIKIFITNKVAKAAEEYNIVCGNSNYVVSFTFDDEWQQHTTKTARFVFAQKDGIKKHIDVVFDGTECEMPVLSNTHFVEVGVFAGDLKTTTPCMIRCEKSILCESGLPEEPEPNVYDQILQKCDEAVNTANEAKEKVNNADLDATEKANEAEKNAKKYTDARLGDLFSTNFVGTFYDCDGMLFPKEILGVKKISFSCVDAGTVWQKISLGNDVNLVLPTEINAGAKVIFDVESNTATYNDTPFAAEQILSALKDGTATMFSYFHENSKHIENLCFEYYVPAKMYVDTSIQQAILDSWEVGV